LFSFYYAHNFYCATCMHSADYAVAIKMSVCPSVCHTPVFSLNGYTVNHLGSNKRPRRLLEHGAKTPRRLLETRRLLEHELQHPRRLLHVRPTMYKISSAFSHKSYIFSLCCYATRPISVSMWMIASVIYPASRCHY